MKCHECPFFSSYLPNSRVRSAEFTAYFDAIGRHLDAATAEAAPDLGMGPPIPLYFGGGTPTVVGAHHVEVTLGRVQSAGIRLSEITVEGNPEDVAYPYVESMIGMGVTRMSMGVQSTDSGMLRMVGSPHTPADTDVALAAMRAHSMPFNVDLLYGLPQQSASDIDRELAWALGVRPSSITWYPYAIRPEGIVRLERGRRPPILATAGPDEAAVTIRQMYLHIRQAMIAAGYAEAMAGAFHLRDAVLQYSQRGYRYAGGILGIGARAYSFTGRRLSQADSDPGRYIDNVAAGRPAQRCTGDLSDLHLLIRSTMLSLMYGEIRPPELARWHELPEASDFQAAIEGWQSRGWACYEGADGLRLTAEGLARADDLLGFFWTLT